MKFDMSDLVRGLSKINQQMEDRAVNAAQKMTLDIYADVVAGSPVDEGDFRQAWTVETPEKMGDEGVIENTMPYAAALARGHSKQAPNGWIDNAVNNAVRKAGK